MAEDKVQKVVYVNKKPKPFEIFGVKIDLGMLQMMGLGASISLTVGMLIAEINRRKNDASTNQTIMQLQQQLAEIQAQAPNVTMQEIPAQPQPQQQQQQPPPPPQQHQGEGYHMGDNGNGGNMYYDYINNVDDTNSNDTNLNTIRPFMDNTVDRAANLSMQQDMYQKQRKQFNFNHLGNPQKSQHLTTNTDYDAEYENSAMPSAQARNARTSNTVRQGPQKSVNNMWVGKDGVVRKQVPRPEIAVNIS